jgi:hypothetical protein
MEHNSNTYDTTSYGLIERKRMEVNEAMAAIFDPVDGVDLVLTASNPDIAFAADGPLPNTFGGVKAGRCGFRYRRRPDSMVAAALRWQIFGNYTGMKRKGPVAFYGRSLMRALPGQTSRE